MTWNSRDGYQWPKQTRNHSSRILTTRFSQYGGLPDRDPLDREPQTKTPLDRDALDRDPWTETPLEGTWDQTQKEHGTRQLDRK